MNWINLLLRGSKAIEKNSTLVAHLEELRKRLIFVLAFFVVVMVGSLTFVGKLYHFLSRPLAGMKLLVLGPGDVVQVYFMIAGVVAFAVTTPFLLWQLWKFVSPGLYPKEKSYAKRLILPVTIMFVLGISFGYFIIFPEIIHFLKNLAEQNFTVSFTAKEYFAFMFNIVIPFGLLFEMPILIVFLTRIGVLTPQWLRKMRRIAYFLFVLLGVLISPPELISHLSVVIPMVLIYEISIWLAAIAYRRKLAAEAWWREEQAVSQGKATEAKVDEEVAGQAMDTPQEGADQTESVLPEVPVGESDDDPMTPNDPNIEDDATEVLGDIQVVSERLLAQLQQPPVFRQKQGIHLDERE